MTGRVSGPPSIPNAVTMQWSRKTLLSMQTTRRSNSEGVPDLAEGRWRRAHSRFPGHALTPTGVMAIRCKQFHLPDL